MSDRTFGPLNDLVALSIWELLAIQRGLQLLEDKWTERALHNGVRNEKAREALQGISENVGETIAKGIEEDKVNRQRNGG